MRRALVIWFFPFVLCGCPDKSKDAAKPGASAEPAGAAKEEDKGGW